MPAPEPMKSFHVYLSEPVGTPDQLAPEISPEDQAYYRQQFAQQARSYRRHRKILTLAFVITFLTFGLICLLQNKHLGWIVAGPVVITFIIAISTPKLVCTNCHNDLESGGPFCPACGARALEPATMWKAEHCSACGRDLTTSSKGRRQYRIRACTHCGLWLDDAGV